MKAKLLGILFPVVVLGGIFYYSYRWEHSRMEDFARERGMELVDAESHVRDIGPHEGTYGRGVSVYRAVYRDKAGLELPYWFRFAGTDVCIYQEPSPRSYIHIK
jgi:hypothetical protein